MAKPAGPGPWAPFAHVAFTMLWVAQLVSNLGSWMQSVGAQWFLVEQSHSPTLVAWVQTAGQLPVLLLSLLAGVMADRFDRRRLLIVMTLGSAVTAGVLFVLAAAGDLTPAGLLWLTFVLGCTAALTGPAWQAIQPELVPRNEIAAASSLGSITVNGARVVGPAIAGAIIAASGTAPVFALNAVSFLAIVVALLLWRRRPPATAPAHEPFGEAVVAGVRYVAAAPGVRRILLRAALFALPAAGFWSLLPTIARARLDLGAGGYGVLLGALGLGSVAGVVLIPLLRRRWSSTLLLTSSAAVFGLGAIGTATLPLVPVVVLLLPMGAAWIATLTTLNATLQLTVADWVRARALAVYLIVFIGGQGVAAFIWGLLAGAIGSVPALIVAGVVLLLTAVSVLSLPLRPASGTLDRTPVPISESGPALVFQPDADQPVAITVAYHVEAEDVDRFLTAVQRLSTSRRRTGAYRWRLDRLGTDQHMYREQFVVHSWDEYQRSRAGHWTAHDAAMLQQVQPWVTAEERWFPVNLPSTRAGRPPTTSSPPQPPKPSTVGGADPAGRST